MKVHSKFWSISGASTAAVGLTLLITSGAFSAPPQQVVRDDGSAPGKLIPTPVVNVDGPHSFLNGYSTDFEAPFVPGPINFQPSDLIDHTLNWGQQTSPAIVVANANPPGNQHLRLSYDPGIASGPNFDSARLSARIMRNTEASTLMPPQGGIWTIEFDAAMTNIASDIRIVSQDRFGPLPRMWQMVFSSITGEVYYSKGGFTTDPQFAPTGVNIDDTGAYHHWKIVNDACSGFFAGTTTTTYYYDNNPVPVGSWTGASGNGPLVAGCVAEQMNQLIILSNNFNGSFFDMDNLSITPEECFHLCGNGILEPTEGCDTGVPCNAGHVCDIVTCQCDRICTLADPCILHNGSNGLFTPPFDASGAAYFLYDAGTQQSVAIDTCGTPGDETGILYWGSAGGGDSGSSNDDCCAPSAAAPWCNGSDETAACYDPSDNLTTAYSACTCYDIPSVYDPMFLAQIRPTVSGVVVNINHKTVCGPDCDGNGIADKDEPNPADRDCDQDGVCDGVEIANCPPANLSCADCNSNGIPDGCEQGACCLDLNGDSIYEGCSETSEPACTLASGIFRGYCKHCPTQNAAIIPEPGGGVFVHVIGPPIDCIAGTSLALRGGCPPGGPFFDAWKSDPNASMCHNFGAAGQSIPADFFNPGSDVFAGSLCLAGVPLGAPGYGEADTLIQRSADPFDRCALSSATPVNVQIDIFALSLGGTAPMTVTYNGGVNPELWTVAVDLSSIAPPSGTLTATKTHCNGGTYTSLLYVQPRFTFTKVGDPGQVRVLDTGEASIPYITFDQQTPAPWVHDVDPNLGLSGDPCTHFHAGIDDQVHLTACDCNTNLTRDKCDIEQGASVDCNLNEIPDSCDLFTCNDSDPCTDDVCTFGVGCEYEFNIAPCDDGNACTTDDTCSAGACVGGPTLDCNDDNVCTVDTCDTVTGCDNNGTGITIFCVDGNACTTGDVCQGDAAGTCAGIDTSLLDCDDGNVCTVDTCDTVTGCDNNPYPPNSCPPPSTNSTTKLYEFVGNVNGANGAWCLREPCCFEAKNLNVPGTLVNMLTLRNNFITSVNNLGCGNKLKAMGVGNPNDTTNGKFMIKADKCVIPFEFRVGHGPAASCGALTVVLPIPGPDDINVPAQYNPDVYEIPLSGVDCNGNGEDDLIDILEGTSLDANGNGIPDECEAIPTVSAWGLVILTLLLLAGAKVAFGRKSVLEE